MTESCDDDVFSGMGAHTRVRDILQVGRARVTRTLESLSNATGRRRTENRMRVGDGTSFRRATLQVKTRRTAG